MCLADLQDALASIDENSVKCVADCILKTDMIHSEDSVKLLADDILQAAERRPWVVKNLVQLLTYLLDAADRDNCLSSLKNHIIPTDLMKQRWYRSFLMFALRNRVLLFSDLIRFMKSMDIGKPLLLLFCWFAPILEKKANDVFFELMEVLENNGKHLNADFRFFLSKLNEMKKSNWELHKEWFLVGYYRGTLPSIIRKDNIDNLRKYLNTPNSDIDYNMRIHSTLFERCDILHHNPTLIQFAAYYGSIKCFSYLAAQDGIDLTLKDDNGVSLLQFAIAGGNQNIIQVCESLNPDMEGIVETLIKYQRLDLLKRYCEQYNLNIIDCNEMHASALHFAAKYNNVSAILYCLTNNMDVNIKDYHVRIFILMFIFYF